jgi:predicted esterase
MSEPRPYLVATPTHGRYLVDAPRGAGPFPLLLGFHGYAESADTLLAHLIRIDPRHQWLRVSVQGLHRFYAKGDRVVASWMTRENRLEAIADNLAYAAAVRAAVARDYAVRGDVVVVGFSQGAAQAYRVAAGAGASCRGVVALGGDLPPDVAPAAATLPPVLIGRGVRDEWYSPAKLAADVAMLEGAGVALTVCEFDGAHEWAEPFVVAASEWLAQRLATAGRG